jgi:5'-nucleotidase
MSRKPTPYHPSIFYPREETMKRILLTNDDGFDAPGLRALRQALKGLAQIIVVAPSLNKSACARSLTLSKPLRFVQLENDCYKLDDGTPTDCIYLAMHALFDDNTRPDLVISGINAGANMGEDVSYSGTAAGAMEGATHGIPSLAISQVCKGNINFQNFDFELAKVTIRDIASRILDGDNPIPDRHILNLNIPPIPIQDSKGYKVTKAGYRLYGNDAHLHQNPRGDSYYWLGLHPLHWIPDDLKMSDLDAVDEGHISITPIKINMTAHEEIPKLQAWL